MKSLWPFASNKGKNQKTKDNKTATPQTPTTHQRNPSDCVKAMTSLGALESNKNTNKKTNNNKNNNITNINHPLDRRKCFPETCYPDGCSKLAPIEWVVDVCDVVVFAVLCLQALVIVALDRPRSFDEIIGLIEWIADVCIVVDFVVRCIIVLVRVVFARHQSHLACICRQLALSGIHLSLLFVASFLAHCPAFTCHLFFQAVRPTFDCRLHLLLAFVDSFLAFVACTCRLRLLAACLCNSCRAALSSRDLQNRGAFLRNCLSFFCSFQHFPRETCRIADCLKQI